MPRPNSDAHYRLPIQDFGGIDDPVALRSRLKVPILRWQTHVRLCPLMERERGRERKLQALNPSQLKVQPPTVDHFVLCAIEGRDCCTEYWLSKPYLLSGVYSDECVCR